MTETTDIRFAGWILRRSAGELVRDGVCIRLQERPLQILEQLLARPGELVTREQLIAHLWPSGVVDFDTGLNTAVRKLRIALNDDAETPRFIETIPRRGYRFIGQIESQPSDSGVYMAPGDAAAIGIDSPEPLAQELAGKPIQRSRWLTWSLLAVLLVAGLIGTFVYKHHRASLTPEIAATIVVLPFVDMSAEQQDQPFCDGLSEELSNWLAQVPSLRVVSRTSAFAYKGKNIDTRQIGRELNATHVLEGSVRRNGKDVRVTAQLINAKDGLHLWSKSFDMPFTDIIQVQDQVSQAVTAALKIRLNDVMSTRLAGRHPQNVNAYELYLLAQHYYRQRTAEGNERAIGLGRQAIDADPTFALAYAGVAAAHINELYFSDRALTEIAIEVEALLDKAMTLNPNLAEVFTVRGQLRQEQYKLVEAERDLQRALEINPNSVDAYDTLARVFDQKGDSRGAIDSYVKAADLDPLDFMRHVRLCNALGGAARIKDATSACTRARELNPKSRWPAWALSWLAKSQGNLAEALRWNQLEVQADPGNAEVYEDRYMLLLEIGMQDEANTALKSAIAMYGSDQASKLLPAYGVLASQGTKALANYLSLVNFDDSTSANTLSLASQLATLANHSTIAEQLLARAKLAPQLDKHRLRRFSDMRWGTADEITVALIAREKKNQVELSKALTELIGTLDRLERDGSYSYGFDKLRGEALALQGDTDGAMRYLTRAVERGWRATWIASIDPSLSELRHRKDFRELIARMERFNAQERTILEH